MTLDPTKLPKPWMIIAASFDIDQVSSQLDYGFSASDHDPQPPVGRHAGGVHFLQSQNVFFEVAASGSKASGFSSFQIVDCCIITRPKVTQCGPDVPTRYSPPSPFLQTLGATHPLALDFWSTVDNDPPPDYRRIIQTWKQSLTVANTGGHWEISLVLTVRIQRGDTAPPELRVFHFDPEGSVGAGSGWDDDDT